MTNKYIWDKIEYSPKEIRMANPRIVYFVYFPQGVREYSKEWTTYGSMMRARNLKKAYKLLEKHNGSYFERMLECDLGRWCIRAYVRHEDANLSYDDLWDKYCCQPEIVKGKKHD